MIDPIADMLIRIKNAQAVKKETVIIPYSKMKTEIARLLLQGGYVNEINRRGKKLSKIIEIALKYDEEGEPLIKDAKRVSKSGRRVYMPYRLIRPVRQGFGMRIISTSKGLLTDKEARKAKLGGEVVCEIY